MSAAVFLLPVMFSSGFRNKHRETLQKQWKGIVAIGAFMAANIALNNTSLARCCCADEQSQRNTWPLSLACTQVSMTLTLNQIIRCTPVHHCM